MDSNIMHNYIMDNLDVLKAKHYVRKATATTNYWFDFMEKKLQKYVSKYGADFCMVIYGSESEDDAYIMPYTDVAILFAEQNLDKRGGRTRWMGTIRDNIIRLDLSGYSMPISQYHNAYYLLDDAKHKTYQVKEQRNFLDLQQKILEFNQKYRDQPPHMKRVVANQVARPGKIADYVKQLQNYTCQICHQSGFVQIDGNLYVEAHHIARLHQLVPGSYCSDNIIIVCANCHRKLHYASVNYSCVDELNIAVTVNNETYTFSRNVVSDVAKANDEQALVVHH